MEKKVVKSDNLTIFSIIISVIVVFLIAYAFYQKNTKDDDQVVEINEDSVLVKDIPNNQVEKENNMETTENNENIAKNGDVLVMNYTGKLTNGTVFDSNVDPKFNHVVPFEFTLGAGQVIKGWDEGLLGMKVGEKKTLTIAPEDAYGDRSPSPLIPANSTLIFEVELLGIK